MEQLDNKDLILIPHLEGNAAHSALTGSHQLHGEHEAADIGAR